MRITTRVSSTNFRKNIAKYYKIAIDDQPIVISKSWKNAVLLNFHLYKDLVELLEELLGEKSLSHAIQEKRSAGFARRIKELGFTENEIFGEDIPNLE